ADGNIVSDNMPSAFDDFVTALRDDFNASPGMAPFDCVDAALNTAKALLSCLAGARGNSFARANCLADAASAVKSLWDCVAHPGKPDDSEPRKFPDDPGTYCPPDRTPITGENGEPRCEVFPYFCGDGSIPGDYPNECTRGCGDKASCRF